MKREIRSGSLVGVAGVGAVIDVGTESFVIPGIEKWRQKSLSVLSLPRLSRRLGKVLKTTSAEKPTLEVKRFPRAMFCEKCRKIAWWKGDMERKDAAPACSINNCGGALVPMRFVLACKAGHLSDFNWAGWAHSGHGGASGCVSYSHLTFNVNPQARSGGLDSLIVKCELCGAGRSLADITNKDAYRSAHSRCSGKHPWIFKSEPCEEEPVVLQRGATNLHYPVTISALDIPELTSASSASEFAAQIRSNARYEKLKNMMSSSSGDNQDFIDILTEKIADETGCQEVVVVEVVNADANGIAISSGESGSTDPFDQSLLLREEWKTMQQALESGGLAGENFVAVADTLSEQAPPWASRIVNGVLLLERLREVRAYRGFQRVSPTSMDDMVAPDIGADEPWLPSSEVFGEGILLSFEFKILLEWALALPESERFTLAQLEQKRLDENFWFLPPVDPVFLAIHALCHLLLRQITFECGYSSSSIRERIYFSSEHQYAGFMIFTADGDSEGSMGGLVRQGRKDRLSPTLYEAIEHGRWCSADPVCSETAGQGLGGFNRACCHACLLVSETSCTYANTLLDRRMLLDPAWGLLAYLEAHE